MELEATKNNLIDIYEKQLRFLKEQKEDLELKHDNLHAQLKDKSNLHDHLLLENRTIQRRVENDVGEIRIQLRIKSEEVERLSNINDELSANLKSHKLENDMLREKLSTLKSEYYKVEANSKQEHADIRAQLAFAKEKISSYEAIEKEIDDAIVGLAGGAHDGNNVYMATLNMAPTTTKRRVQQAMMLAQKLNVKEKECEELKKKVGALEQTHAKHSEELELTKGLLNKTNQPYNYLISDLEGKEREMMELRQKAKRAEQDYQNIKHEYQIMKGVNRYVLRFVTGLRRPCRKEMRRSIV